MQAWARLVPVLALAFAAVPAVAADDMANAIKACREESDAALRLACYDRAAGRAQPSAKAAPAPAAKPPAAPAAAVVAVPAAAAPAPTAADNFGREHQIAAEQQERQQQVARELGELEATVSRIETRMDGLMTFTLDNGQVWRQNTLDSKFKLKEGDPVKIQPGSMKSFILSGPTKKSTRVTRVK